MDLKRLSSRAKDLVEKRGGPESLKQDAGELRNIAKGPGSFKDKAMSAAEALKRAGASGAGSSVGEKVQDAAPAPNRKDDRPAREARERNAEDRSRRGRGEPDRGRGAGTGGRGGSV